MDGPSLVALQRPRFGTLMPLGGAVHIIKGSDQFSGTNQVVKGIGVVNRLSLYDRNGYTYLFAFTHLEIFDGRTFERLKQGGGSLYDETLGERLVNDMFRPLRGPSRKLENFAWPPASEAVTKLREPTRALLATSLDTVLPKLLAQ